MLVGFCILVEFHREGSAIKGATLYGDLCTINETVWNLLPKPFNHWIVTSNVFFTHFSHSMFSNNFGPNRNHNTAQFELYDIAHVAVTAMADM